MGGEPSRRWLALWKQGHVRIYACQQPDAHCASTSACPGRVCLFCITGLELILHAGTSTCSLMKILSRCGQHPTTATAAATSHPSSRSTLTSSPSLRFLTPYQSPKSLYHRVRSPRTLSKEAECLTQCRRPA